MINILRNIQEYILKAFRAQTRHPGIKASIDHVVTLMRRTCAADGWPGGWFRGQCTAFQSASITRLVAPQLCDAHAVPPRCLHCAQAHWCKPPNVWLQLLDHLWSDVACRQALLEPSSEPAVALVDLRALTDQVAATLAEELAVGMAVQRNERLMFG